MTLIGLTARNGHKLVLTIGFIAIAGVLAWLLAKAAGTAGWKPQRHDVPILGETGGQPHGRVENPGRVEAVIASERQEQVTGPTLAAAPAGKTN